MTLTPFAHYLPYWHSQTWQTNLGPLPAVAMFDGTLFCGVEASGIDVFSAEDETLNAVTRHIGNALNSLPADAYVQSEWSVGYSFDDVLDDYANRCTTGPDIVREQRKARLAFLRADKDLRRGRLHLFFGKRQALGRFSAMSSGKRTLLEKLKGSAATKGAKDITADEVLQAVQGLAVIANRFLSELAAAGMSFTFLSEEGLIERMFAALNPVSSNVVAPPRIVDSPPTNAKDFGPYLISRQFTLREQLPRGDLFLGDTYFTLDEPALRARALSLQTLPTETTPDYLFPTQFALTKPYRVVTTHVATDFEAEMGKLLRRQKLATSETGGHVRNIQAEIARGESEGMIALAARENQRIFQSSVTVIVTGESDAELDASTAAMKDAFRNAGDMSTEVGRQLKSFLSSLPGCGFLSPRSWGIHTNAAADLVPYFVPTLGDAEAQLVYHTRQSSLFKLSYSPNTHRTNRNGLVFGPAGTGKSFTIANIFEQAGLADGCSVDVIDVQGPAVSNYKVLAELFGGAYIPLGSGDGSVGLNAFPAPDDLLQRNEVNGQFVINERGTREVDQNKLREAAATALLIGAPHYASDPYAALYEEVAQEALLLAYKNVRHRHLQDGGLKETAPGPVVTDFIAVLDSTAQSRDQAPHTLEPRGPEYVDIIRKLVVTLTSRMRNPTWARLLNRRTAQPAVQFRVYDFFGMDKEPELASVLIQMMTNQVWDTIQATGREKSKHIYYDECWKLIAHPTAAANIAELFRTGRKWGASVWAITQSLDDLRQTPVAKALLANSSTVWLNRHAIDHDSVAEFCSLNSRQASLFTSLQFKKNQYSEILFVDRTTSGATVLRSKPTPFDLWINTTNPADVGFRERVRRERNISMAEAIRYCAENHPQGAPR